MHVDVCTCTCIDSLVMAVDLFIIYLCIIIGVMLVMSYWIPLCCAVDLSELLLM